MKKFTITYENGFCNCDICFTHYERVKGKKQGKKIAKLTYYTQDFKSNKSDKICTTAQKHPHELWICDKCLSDLGLEWLKTFDDRYKIWRKNDEQGRIDEAVQE